VTSDTSFLRRVPEVNGVEAFTACFARFSYARHSHESYALGTVDEGAMRFWHGGTQHLASNGEVIAINPGEVHDGHAGSAAGCRYRMLYIERSLAHQAHVAELLLSLFTAYGRPPLVAREIGDEKPIVSRAKDYLADHLCETVRLPEVAAAVGLSPFYFLRAFKRSTGMPPHAYLNQLRLERARALLRAGESAAQTAAALCFVDQSHLTRRFKAAFGVTPGQYRAATPKGLPPSSLR